jgi:phosphoglycolate phosphatase
MLEIIRPFVSAANARAVIFDFDGTLSLIRSGWMDVMVPMCVEQLSGLNTSESAETLKSVVEDFVWRLTGKETIYQMMALADAVHSRGGSPLEPAVYKKMYLDRLWTRIESRIVSLRDGSASPEKYLVPGSRKLLEELKQRNLTLYLASGTDDANVKEEAALLDIDFYFDGRIYGALDDLTIFSKAILVRDLVSKAGHRGDELLVFGDGYVEIEEVKKVGGTAVGVASAEPDCILVDEWKRKRLIGVGADVVIPNFEELSELTQVLFVGAALSA